MLFADLVSFTARAERMDPEDVRALQDRYWGQVRSELERHGGTVEKFIGDAVMALFGAPRAFEDDPERAVRSALAIRDWAAEQEGLQIRIAVTTGEALVNIAAQPLRGEGMASGDVVNTASRLQTAAPENGVLVDETTHRATKHLVEYRRVTPVAAKGKGKSISVWEAVRTRAPIRPEREARAPFVGRHEELSLLEETFRRSTSSVQLVTLRLSLPNLYAYGPLLVVVIVPIRRRRPPVIDLPPGGGGKSSSCREAVKLARTPRRCVDNLWTVRSSSGQLHDQPGHSTRPL